MQTQPYKAKPVRARSLVDR